MGDDMGGFKHGGPLMGYRDGGWPPWEKSILPYPDLPYEGIGLSKPAQRGALRSLGALGGLPALLIAELLGMSAFPERMGAGTVDEWKEREKKTEYLADLKRIQEEDRLDRLGYFDYPVENKPYVFSSSGAMGRRR